MANIQVNPRPHIIQGALYLGTQYRGLTTSVSYYNAQDVGAPHVAEYSVDITVDVSSIQENPDGSIEFDYVGLKSVRVHTTMNTNTNPYRVTYVLDVDTSGSGSLREVFRQSTTLSSAFDTGVINFSRSNKQHVKLLPGQSFSAPDRRILKFRSLTGVIDDEFDFYVGTNFITNRNEPPKNIKPWAIRKSDVFKTHSRESGYFKKRVSGSWKAYSEVKIAEVGKPNVGSSRIRKSGTFVCQNKIGVD